MDQTLKFYRASSTCASTPPRGSAILGRPIQRWECRRAQAAALVCAVFPASPQCAGNCEAGNCLVNGWRRRRVPRGVAATALAGGDRVLDRGKPVPVARSESPPGALSHPAFRASRRRACLLQVARSRKICKLAKAVKRGASMVCESVPQAIDMCRGVAAISVHHTVPAENREVLRTRVRGLHSNRQVEHHGAVRNHPLSARSGARIVPS